MSINKLMHELDGRIIKKLINCSDLEWNRATYVEVFSKRLLVNFLNFFDAN